MKNETERMLNEMLGHKLIHPNHVKRLMKESKNDVAIGWINAWVKVLYDSFFKAYMAVYNLPGANWAMYQLLKLKDLPEQKLLEDAKVSFQIEWQATYPFKKRAKDADAEKTPGVTGGVPRDGIDPGVQDSQGSDGPELLHPSGDGSDQRSQGDALQCGQGQPADARDSAAQHATCSPFGV